MGALKVLYQMSKSVSFAFRKQNRHPPCLEQELGSRSQQDTGPSLGLLGSGWAGGGENQGGLFGVEKRKATKRARGPWASEEAIP